MELPYHEPEYIIEQYRVYDNGGSGWQNIGVVDSLFSYFIDTASGDPLEPAEAEFTRYRDITLFDPGEPYQGNRFLTTGQIDGHDALAVKTYEDDEIKTLLTSRHDPEKTTDGQPRLKKIDDGLYLLRELGSGVIVEDDGGSMERISDYFNGVAEMDTDILRAALTGIRKDSKDR